MTEQKTKYSVWKGIFKTAKNSAILLIPFVLAVMADVPLEYAWFVGPATYFLKNAYENRTLD